jgi:hypothetical protein
MGVFLRVRFVQNWIHTETCGSGSVLQYLSGRTPVVTRPRGRTRRSAPTRDGRRSEPLQAAEIVLGRLPTEFVGILLP